MGTYLDWSWLWQRTLTKGISACHKCDTVYPEPEADYKLCCPACGYYGEGICDIPHEIVTAAIRGARVGKVEPSWKTLQLATVVFVCVLRAGILHNPTVVLDADGAIRIRVSTTTTLVVDDDGVVVSRISPVYTDIPEIWEVPNIATLSKLLEDA